MNSARLHIVKDMSISIGANAAPLLILQLVVLPALGAHVSVEEYGLAITLASFFSFCPATLGSVLNNIRLIRDADYPVEKKGEDFGVLAAIAGTVSFMASTAYAASIANLSLLEYLMLGCTGLMFFLGTYWVVAFRLSIDYRAIFAANCTLATGYLIGFFLLMIAGLWELVYFTGQACMVAYLMRKTGIWKEPVRKTEGFSTIAKESILLSISTFLARVSGYCDRMILFPLLGATAASVYYVSTLLAKIVSLLTSSANNVILSYLAKESVASKRKFWITLAVGVVTCALCYGIVMAVSPVVLSLLYPQFAQEALSCLPITSCTAFVMVLTGLVDPYVLRYRPMSWQLLFSSLSVTVYVCAAIFLMGKFGLIGFCWGALIAESVRLMAEIAVFCFSKKERKEQL